MYVKCTSHLHSMHFECILNMDIFSCMDRMNRRRLFGTQQTCLGGTFKEDVGRRFGTLPFKVWFGMVGIDGCCMLLQSAACSPRLMRTVYNRYKSVQERRFRGTLFMSG